MNCTIYRRSIEWLSCGVAITEVSECNGRDWTGPHSQNGCNPLLREEDLEFCLVLFCLLCCGCNSLHVFVFAFVIFSTQPKRLRDFKRD
jgi:hypothetical protein